MPRAPISSLYLHLFLFLGWYTCSSSGKIGGWDTAPNTQYHIQTDEGPERFFRYQTMSGQYRKEKRLQDGSVVGTYGWVDADGFLRLRDYIADDKGYRIVRTKMVRVGPVENTIAQTTTTTTAKPPITLSDYLREKQAEEAGLPKVEIVPNGVPSSTPSPLTDYIRPTTYRPYYNPNSLDQRAYPSQQQQQQQVYAVPQQSTAQQVYSQPQQQQSTAQQVYSQPQQQQSTAQQVYSQPQQQQSTAQQVYSQPQQQQAYSNQHQEPYSEPALYNEPYDGVATTQNGFRYYLPRQYHEEETLSGERRAGSFGYVDPFGIRRVIYYNTAPGSGFVHRKNNRYVGFRSTPYDPRF